MECCSRMSRIIVILAAIVICLSLIGLIIISVIYGLSVNVPSMYSVVIDAGSTSSKLSLFEWTDKPFRTNGEVKEITGEKVSPGISNYVDTPYEAYKMLALPLQTLIQNLSDIQKSRTPVYLAATAGMRLEMILDPLGCLDLFEALRRGLLHSGLQVQTPNERIRLLSGPEEGLYGWVSVNYILENIRESKPAPPSETIGSLDLGGASTQIAFIPSRGSPTPELSTHYYPLKLYGMTYNVYSHSFLCYGKSQFEKRTMGTVIVNANKANTSSIENPCYLQGYEITDIDPNSIFSGPCMSGSYALKTFSSQLQKPSGLRSFKFVGTGEVEKCKQFINQQFVTSKCDHSSCSFNNIHQPTPSGPFMAYSGFSYVMAYLFPKQNTGLKLSQVEAKVREFCTTPWKNIADITPLAQQPFVAKYCFDGLFAVALLKGYGFTTDAQWEKITFSAKVRGTSVSWAMGYMLDESGHLPSESPKVAMNIVAFVLLFVLFCILLITAIVFLCIYKRED